MAGRLSPLPLRDCHNRGKTGMSLSGGSWVWGPVCCWPSLPVGVPLRSRHVDWPEVHQQVGPILRTRCEWLDRAHHRASNLCARATGAGKCPQGAPPAFRPHGSPPRGVPTEYLRQWAVVSGQGMQPHPRASASSLQAWLKTLHELALAQPVRPSAPRPGWMLCTLSVHLFLLLLISWL